MNFWGKLAVAASVAWISSTAFALTDPTTRPGESLSALESVDASDDARYVEHWIHEKGDDHGRPFVIVDKKAARIYVFGAGGKLVGESSTILGQSRGDIPVPGAGQKDPSRLLPYERKTPAGRFESQPGKNLHGEPVVWVDYDTGIAIHRVRPGISQMQRDASLATEDPNNKRLSLGCVVVPETSSGRSCCPRWATCTARSTCCRKTARCRRCSPTPRPTPPSPRARVNVSAR
jgi:hypothetical protein